ncbi:MAG: PAS domain S-box protein, partial [Deltaproteobacteria bacterium]|nr:PAS domain S-box protein [Deltaproteobacteria bacterium]
LYVDLSATSVRRPNGSVDYVLVVLSDITEKKRAEQAMRNSEERFRTLMDTIPDLIWLKDADGVYLACNKMFTRFFGAREEDILGKTDYDFVDRELADFFRFHDRKAMEAGKPISNEEWVTFADDGHRALLDTIKTPMSDAEGKLVGVLGIARDISERKRAEDEKLQLESQLRQAQKMEAIGTLAGGIAHDFNNILSIIFGYNELAMKEKDPKERQRHLEELHKGAVRAKELVKQILTFSRKTEQEPQPLQVSLIVKEALTMLRASIPTTIEIRQNITSTGMVLADPTQIHQVIMNLCTNAFHAMQKTGGILAVSLDEVKIRAEDYGYAELAPGNYLKLEVSDTGYGIEPKILEKIFEPYFTTKQFGEGTGMGLAVVHGIVKSHHGHIAVHSELGNGTSFDVYLPLTEQVAGALPDRTPPKELLGTGERVLFVDDEAQIRGVVEAILSKHGYQVTTCADGMQAWKEFQKEPDQFDLVLTDMTMPFMTGAELAQKILTLRPQTPVILCTGQSELINREKALAMGIRDYLNKPVQTEQLLVAVKKTLKKR